MQATLSKTLQIFTSIFLIGTLSLQGQEITAKFLILDETGLPMPGVHILIRGSDTGVETDFDGKAKLVVRSSETVQISMIGYASWEQQLTQEILESTIEVRLQPSVESLENVVLQSTRKSRQIADEVNRIEVIAGEELEEKFNMNSSNISMLLRESTGIQVQQTSATSANMNFKIQGLDGRYTQMLQDGLPLYAGFSGGLSIMQIPPLNLKQVEIIKGSNSTLYGGGAIAGIINLITKVPEEESDLDLMISGMSSGGMDLNGYYAGKAADVGITLYATANFQNAYDPDGDQFSDIPEARRYTINPRLFFYLSENTTLDAGVNFTREIRKGGYLKALSNQEEGYMERNASQRISYRVNFTHDPTPQSRFTMKGNLSTFDRSIEETRLSRYDFSGYQVASFVELNYYHKMDDWEWVVGFNSWSDRFTEKNPFADQTKRDYTDYTVGSFLQTTWTATTDWTLELGLRMDRENHYGLFTLPRFSVMYKAIPSLTFRLGGGEGYKTPNIFIQKAEDILFRNIAPTSSSLKAERSRGVNFDYNYKFSMGDAISVSVNQLWFYTFLENPLDLQHDAKTKTFFIKNTTSHLDTKGVENNVKIAYAEYKLFLQYTYIDAQKHLEEKTVEVVLTPRHRAGMVLMYEVEDVWRMGYELYYTGSQRRPVEYDVLSRDFFTMGFMADYSFEPIPGVDVSVYVNFENFTDVRMTRWERTWTGTDTKNPFFKGIYAPTDGFVFTGGLKFRL